ncbi:hypothetical protein, partial [Aestuariibaculum suncheonense]
MNNFTNYIKNATFLSYFGCFWNSFLKQFASIASMITVMLFLCFTTTVQAQCELDECKASYIQGLGNGPDPCAAKLYCSNSGAVESGLINCTSAADTDGCGIDASQAESMVSMYVDASPSTKLLFGGAAQSGAQCDVKDYLQWIVFATPPKVKGTKIQAVGASDSWFLFHAGAFTTDPLKETADIPYFETVKDALLAPTRCTSFNASDMVECSDVNQYKPWTNDNAIISDDVYNIYFIGLSYNRPTNGSLNFKVKECEMGCEVLAECNLTDQDIQCAADFPPALTDPYQVFNIADACEQELTMDYVEVDNPDTSEAGYEYIESITRTYKLYANNIEVAECVQTITNKHPLPTLPQGRSLGPEDFDININACIPSGPIGITSQSNLFEECDGVATRSNSLLRLVLTDVTGNDCSWTATVNIFIDDPVNPGELLLLISVPISGGDATPPVLTHTNAETYPDGYDFGCGEPVEPTFSATDNCTENLVPDVVPGEVQINGCVYSRTWTVNVNDACNNPADEVSVTYTWIEAIPITIAQAPQDDSVSACDYEEGDFAAWIAAQEAALGLA